MLSCLIDASEGIKLVNIDISGAFMQSDMDELIYVKLEGTMTEALIKLEPRLYNKYKTIA